jgi:TonB-dependent SusC/RagA subfamily outer membrane receptor
MQAILIYLLKVIACSGLLFGYYWIALRNRQFHQYNRFYLLCTLVLSLVLPILQLEWFTVHSGNETAVKLMQVMYSPVEINAPAQSEAIGWQQVTAALLLLSFVLLLVRLMARVTTIYRLKKKYPSTRLDESVQLIQTDLPQAPFSFLSNLFWRTDIDLDETTGRQILQHEITHIREKHTWDKLFLQTILCVYWMNPFFWLLQRELYLVHEFIADQKAVKDKDASAFAAMLLQAQFGKFRFAPAQPFFYSPIKRRLIMLTTSTDARYSYTRRVMVLPLLAAVCTLFALRIQAQQQKQAETQPAFAGINVAIGTDTQLAPIHVTAFAAAPATETIAAIADTTKPRSYGSYNGKKVKDVFVNTDRTKVILTLEDKTTKEISYTDAVARQIQLPGTLGDVVFAQPGGTLKIVGDQVTLQSADGTKAQADTIIMQSAPSSLREVTVRGYATKTDAADAQPLYILDHVIISPAQFEAIDKNTIVSVSVLKDKSATALYGSAGANGVIVISTTAGNARTVTSATSITPAKFPGGEIEWQKYLQRNLNRFVPEDHKAPGGTYKVTVSFLVDADGTISEVRADNDPGYGTAQEAVRVLKKGPKWIPAVENGKNIRVITKQDIVFQVVASPN